MLGVWNRAEVAGGHRRAVAADGSLRPVKAVRVALCGVPAVRVTRLVWFHV